MITSTNFETAKKNPEMVISINVAYHDIEATQYDTSHPEIFVAESTSWQKLIEPIIVKLRKQSTALTVLDIGTGTGFVPITISPFLCSSDTVILSDVSSEMLEKAEQGLASKAFIKHRLLTIAGYGPVPSSSVDLITINSVLHHIPEPKKLFAEVDRMLKPGGVFIIKHEPNIRFTRNLLLRELYKFLRKLQRGGSHGCLASSDQMLQRVLVHLEKDGLRFVPPLTVGELQSLVDIHSPTANGGLKTNVGFDPFSIATKYFKNADMLSCTTYGHVGKFNEKSNIFRRFVSRMLKMIFPKDGYFFDLIIVKN